MVARKQSQPERLARAAIIGTDVAASGAGYGA